MHGDRPRLEPGDLRHEILQPAGVLHRAADLPAIGADVGQAVDRLHRCVGQERELVRRFHRARGGAEGGIDVTVISDRLPGPAERLEHPLAKHGRVVDRAGHFLPDGIERPLALHGRPGGVGQDGDSLAQAQRARQRRDPHHPKDAGNPLRPGAVERLESVSERRVEDAGKQHPAGAGIEPVARAAGDDRVGIGAANPGADQPVLRCLLERNLCRCLQARRLRGQVSVGCPAAGSRVDDHGRFGPAGGRLDPPARGGRGDEQVPGDRPGLPQSVPVLAHRRASARELVAVPGIEPGLPHEHPLPGHVELLGHDHRQARLHPLPDLRVLGDDGNGAIRPDLDECAERLARGRRRRQRSPQTARQEHGNGQAARRGRAHLHEVSAAHQALSVAARWIAARIR